MTAVLVAGVVLAAILSFCLLKISLALRYENGAVERSFGIGSRRLRHSSRRHPEREEEGVPEERDRDFILPRIKAGYTTLCRLLTLVTVDKLHIRFFAAFRDPAETAAMYGAAALALEGIERLGRVEDRELCATLDFECTKPSLTGEIALSLRVFQMAYLQMFYLRELAKQLKRLERKHENDVRASHNGNDVHGDG